MIKKLILILISTNILVTSWAQESIGLSFGQYNGISATYMNPAFSFRSANKWDLQIAGAHSFGNTNYGFINNANLFRILQNLDEVVIPDSQDDVVAPAPTMTALFNERDNYYFDVKASALAPGFLIHTINNRKFGFSIRGRTQASAHELPSVLNRYNSFGFNADSIYNASASHINAAAWIDYNFHLASQIDKNIVVGINAKYLQGLEAFVVHNKQDFDFQSDIESNLFAIESGAFSLAYTDYNDRTRVKGNGLGFDLGTTINNAFNSGDVLGISLVDVGIIWYKGNNTNYNFVANMDLSEEAYENIDNPSDLTRQLNQDFEVVSDKNRFKIYLPTALSVQYNLPLQYNLQLEAQVTHRITLGAHHLSRSNSMSTALLYEKKYFSAFLPVTLYDYSKLNVGAALRFAYLTVGSDDIRSLFGSQNFDGYDLYFKLVFFPFERKTKKKGKDKGINCYSF